MKRKNPSQFARQVMPIDLVKNLPPPPPKEATKSLWDKFKGFLKDSRIISGSLSGLSRLEILNKYKNFLEAASTAVQLSGYGKKKPKKTKMIKSPKKLINRIITVGYGMHGDGLFSSFGDWIKGAVSKVGDVAKNVGSKFVDVAKTVGSKIGDVGSKAWSYAKEHPLSTLGYVTKGLSWIPSPLSAPLGAASQALGLAGTLSGKGGQEGGRMNQHGKLIMAF